jgi:hypothetical protein
MDEIPTLKVMQKSKFPNQSYLDFLKTTQITLAMVSIFLSVNPMQKVITTHSRL